VAARNNPITVNRIREQKPDNLSFRIEKEKTTSGNAKEPPQQAGESHKCAPAHLFQLTFACYQEHQAHTHKKILNKPKILN